MFFSEATEAQVLEEVQIKYVNVSYTKAWNATKPGDQLRMLTGWAWISRTNGAFQQGFKSRSAAIRDAYYAVCLRQQVPESFTKSGDLRVKKARS